MHFILTPLLGFLVFCASTTHAANTKKYIRNIDGFGEVLAHVPPEVNLTLAAHLRPNNEGAMGRNRSQYIHARFQMGMHNFAIAALANKSAEQLENFLRAAEYAFKHQHSDGSFALTLPKSIKGKKKVSLRDRASGHSFFMATLSSGLLAISSSSHLQDAIRIESTHARIVRVEQQLSRSLMWLIEHAYLLEESDGKAPNRLLINASAFTLSGILLNRKDALLIGKRFLAQAQSLIHRDGYFIEGGGYDSSYNGVAAAWMFQLAIALRSQELLQQAFAALAWQTTRVMKNGKITTQGNSRVHERGEGFLGRKKDVDVGHILEAYSLAFAISGEQKYSETAHRILKRYRP